MANRVCDKELPCRSGISSYLKENAANAVWRTHQRVPDRGSLGGMFIGQFKRVVDQLIILIPGEVFIADIYPAIKPGEIDIDPIGVFGFIIKKCSVLDNLGINRVFERIRVTRFIK